MERTRRTALIWPSAAHCVTSALPTVLSDASHSAHDHAAFGQEHSKDHRCWSSRKPLLHLDAQGGPRGRRVLPPAGVPDDNVDLAGSGEPSTAGTRSRPGVLGVKPPRVAGRHSVPEPDRTLLAGGHRRNTCISSSLRPATPAHNRWPARHPHGRACSSAPPRVPQPPMRRRPSRAATGDHAVDWARSRKGSPYHYGSDGPAPLRLLRPDPLGLCPRRKVIAALVSSTGEQGEAHQALKRASW